MQRINTRLASPPGRPSFSAATRNVSTVCLPCLLTAWALLLLAATTVRAQQEASSPGPEVRAVPAEQTPAPAKPQYRALPFWTDEFVQHDWRIQRNVITDQFRLLDERDRVRLEGEFSECLECFRDLSTDTNLLPVKGKLVIILHGLFRNHRAGIPLQRELNKTGFTAIRIGYASTQAGIDSHAEALAKVIDHLPQATEIHFVGHSMGNIVVRKFLSNELEQNEGKLDPRFGRFVMLGPPNQGSAMATAAGDASLLHSVAGKGFTQLGTNWNQFTQKLAPVPLEFGIIAGNSAHGSQGNPLLAGPDDLVVRVEETRLPGARDFEVLPVVHMRMFSDPTVQEHTLNFLQHGYFVSEQERNPLAAAPAQANAAGGTANEE